MANAGTIKIGVKVDANKIKTEFNVVKSEVANAKDGINSLFQGFSSGSLNSISSGLSGVSSSIGQLTSMAGLAIGPLAIVAASFTALGAAALAASIKITDLGIKGIGMLDELGDRAGKVSVLASELYLLENSAKLLGDEVSDVAPAIGKMTKALGDDKIGSVVAKLGLDLNRLRTQSPGETFRQLADAISQIENPTMRAKIGFELFGKSYMGLANTLSSGQIGFTINELERLGLTLTDQDIVAAGEAQRSFDLLSMSFQRLTMLIGAELAPALNALSVAFMRIVQNAEFGEVIKYLADITVESVATILDAFYYMNLAIKALGLTMKSVVKSMEHGMAFMGGFAGQLLVAAKQVYSAISELDKSENKLKNMSPSWGDDLRRGYTKAQEAAEQAVEAVKKFSFENEQAGDIAKESAEKQESAAQRLINKYQEELKLFGLTGRAREIASLEATEQENTLLSQLNEQLTAEEKRLALIKEAENIKKSLITKEQRDADELLKLEQLRNMNLLDSIEYEMARAKIIGESVSAEEKRQSLQRVNQNLALAGSQEAREILLRTQNQTNSPEVQVQRDILRQTINMVDGIKKLDKTISETFEERDIV